jgi:hypothetical protein
VSPLELLLPTWPDTPLRRTDRPIKRLASGLLATLNECATQGVTAADSRPFLKLQFMGSDGVVYALGRSTGALRRHEFEPGTCVLRWVAQRVGPRQRKKRQPVALPHCGGIATRCATTER